MALSPLAHRALGMRRVFREAAAVSSSSMAAAAAASTGRRYLSLSTANAAKHFQVAYQDNVAVIKFDSPDVKVSWSSKNKLFCTN